MRPPHDGITWDLAEDRPPTVAELREWLADKPDDAIIEARDRRIYVANFGERRRHPTSGN